MGVRHAGEAGWAFDYRARAGLLMAGDLDGDLHCPCPAPNDSASGCGIPPRRSTLLSPGIALKDNISNLAAGILLLVFRPFRVGDFITINETAGRDGHEYSR